MDRKIVSWIIVGVCVCFLATQWVAGADAFHLDPGGVSLDFTRAGPVVQTMGDNLIANGGFEIIDGKTGMPEGWSNRFHVYTVDDNERAVVSAKLMSYGKRLVSQEAPRSGTNCIRILMPTEAYKEHSKSLPDFSNAFQQYCDLGELAEDTKFIVRFQYRGHLEVGSPNGKLRLSLGFVDGADKPWRAKPTRDHMQVFLAAPTRDWQTASMEFVAPKDTRCLNIALLLHGYGDVTLDDVELYQVPIETGVTMLLMPFGMLDNLFDLSSGDASLIRFSFRNETGKKLKKVHAILELPSGITLLDVRADQKLLKTESVPQSDPPMTRYRVDYSGLKNTIAKEAYKAYHSLSCMIRTELPPSEKLLQGRYWVEDDDGASLPKTFHIKISEPIKGKRPTHFKTSAMFGRNGLYERDDAIDAFADFYDNCGFTSAHLPQGKLSLAVAKRGIDRYMQPYWLCNGYRIGSAEKPDNVRFQFVDGTYHDQGICPVEVYKNGAYFKNHVVNESLRDLIVTTRQTDHIMPNWEPYMYGVKGCYCNRCRDEFQKYAKFTPEEMTAIWPQDVFVKYRDLWIKFRSWQHSRMMVAFENAIHALGKEVGLDSHFIPSVATSALIPGGEEIHPGFKNYSVLDYAAELPWLEPWGPYNYFKMDSPYKYTTGEHLNMLASAHSVKNYLAEKIPNPDQRPKLIAFPQGYQGDTWVTQPETLAFETLSMFVGGWEGSFAYYFPRGYDARYWRAMAEANTLIADYEDIVTTGTRSSRYAFKTVSPLPAVQADGRLTRLTNLDWHDQSIVQCVAFEKGAKRLYAIVNAWEKGENFAKLSVTGLEKGARYVLREPHEGRCYAAGPKPTITAEELEKGVLLHTGALRISFFIVEPFDENVNNGRVVTPYMMEQALESRLPAIEKAMAFEAEHAERYRQAEAKESTLPDYSNIKTMKAGNLESRPVVPEQIGSTCIEFTSPHQTVLLDPARSGRIASWRVNGFEIVKQDETLGLGRDAIWWYKGAGAFLEAPRRVVAQTQTADGLSVTLECVLGVEAKEMAGITLRKTLRVPSETSGFTLTTELINTTEATHEFVFRYHNMLSYMEFIDGKRGKAEMKSEAGEVSFERRLMKEMYCYRQEPDLRIEKAFGMEKRKTISSPEIEFSCPWNAIQVRAIPEEDKLHAVIFWDDSRQECATFEPVFEVVTLQPRETWKTSMRWEAK